MAKLNNDPCSYCGATIHNPSGPSNNHKPGCSRPDKPETKDMFPPMFQSNEEPIGPSILTEALWKAWDEGKLAEKTGHMTEPRPNRPFEYSGKGANYYRGDTVMRFIDKMDLNFALGSVIKYLTRAGKKINAVKNTAEGTDPSDALSDYLDARWYLQWHITYGCRRRPPAYNNYVKNRVDDLCVELRLNGMLNFIIMEVVMAQDSTQGLVGALDALDHLIKTEKEKSNEQQQDKNTQANDDSADNGPTTG